MKNKIFLNYEDLELHIDMMNLFNFNELVIDFILKDRFYNSVIIKHDKDCFKDIKKMTKRMNIKDKIMFARYYPFLEKTIHQCYCIKVLNHGF